MMHEFTLNHPTRIYFGIGTLARVGEYAAGLGEHALLVMGHSSMQRLGMADCVETSLKAQGMRATRYQGIQSDPDLSDIVMATEVGVEAKVDFVVALGGGSTIDAGKAVAASIGCGHGIHELFYGKNGLKVSNATLPILAIPSTSGTGSELSMGAILTDREGRKKAGLRSPHLIPRVSVVDPELSIHLPSKDTLVCGFDAFTHAAETYISQASNMVTRMYSAHALMLIGKYLERTVCDKEDMEARIQMTFASMLMGYNLAFASTCLPHRLQYALSLHTPCSHGMGLATLYPAWLKMTSKESRDPLKDVVRFWSGGNSDDWQDLREWILNLNIRKNIREWGGDEDLCKKMAAEVSGNMELDPSYKGNSSVLDLFMDSLD